MNIPLPVTEENNGVPVVCRLLRTKTAYGYTTDGTPWELATSTTAVYWCLHTMGTVGPDDTYAHPHECTAARGCFRKPLE